MVTFTGILTTNGTGGHWVVFPYDARELFGEARAPVAGTVNGTPYRSRLAVYGGVTYLGLTKQLRAAAGIEDGDTVEVELGRDDGARMVEVPAELAAALAADAAAGDLYEALAFTHRREYATWVGEAKKAETRERRAAKAVEMLRAGGRHP
ncbi:MAG: hypothetical protein V7637_3936 [Mycobacteriales bacterium]